MLSEATPVEESIAQDTEDLEPVVEEMFEDETVNCLAEVELPEVIDELYTGVAPVGYIGLDHTMKSYGDASNDEEVR